MYNRILLIVTICLSLILLFMSSNNTTLFYTEPNIKVKDPTTNNVSSLKLEEYIIGVVASEMPASFNEEALKAQAIASRTYAIYKMQNNNNNYDVVTSVSNQGYITIEGMKNKWGNDFDKYYSKIKEVVNSTRGKVMKYKDKIIEAYYFSMSNGYTEDVELVFSESRDYLQSVESIYENENLKNFSVTKTFTKYEICNKLDIVCNNLNIGNIKRSNTNRINAITINGKEYKGTIIRSKLGLRSTDFDIKIDNENVTITTRGYGHGVGMSQYGANGMANAGYNYEEILKYYYKNIEISSI